MTNKKFTAVLGLSYKQLRGWLNNNMYKMAQINHTSGIYTGNDGSRYILIYEKDPLMSVELDDVIDLGVSSDLLEFAKSRIRV